jgi:hypothetical protein
MLELAVRDTAAMVMARMKRATRTSMRVKPVWVFVFEFDSVEF